MPKTINTATTDQWQIDESSTVWTLTQAGSISFNGTAILEDKQQSQNTVSLAGDIHANGTQVGSVGGEFDGKRTDVTVGATALVDTETGFVFGGSRQSLVNTGLINVTGTGVDAGDADKFTLENRGTISGEIGIQAVAASIDNHTKSTISGTAIGIETAGTAGALTTVVNHGTISGAVGVQSGDDTLFLDNSRFITGGVSAGGGFDHLTFHKGSRVTGLVDGGAGNDLIDVLKGSHFDQAITGGAGDDTYGLIGRSSTIISEASYGGLDRVRAYFSYTLTDNVERLYVQGHKNISGTGNDLDNVIFSADGNNLLKGMGGDDVLVNTGGVDTYVGGAGDDTFAFLNHKSVVQDFTQGEDILGFNSESGVKSFDQARIEQHGDDTWIGYSKGAQFRVIAILDNFDHTHLTAEDFHFNYSPGPF